ncbi:MAG: hypothetical protein JW759_07435 [Candidatus Coatesbacteria bacterium]|nr:hypothetical protein [Candidatus Coatesbacteria bacterium]
MRREYTKIVLCLTFTVAVFFGAGVIVAMLYVGPQVTPPGEREPLVTQDYVFADVVLMGVVFGLFSAVLSMGVLIPLVLRDKRKCSLLSDMYGVPLGRVFFLTQSCVVRLTDGSTRQAAFDKVLQSLKSERVWVKVADKDIGCIEAYTQPFFASRVTVKVDEIDGGWEITVVSTPLSGLLILDFGRNFELVTQLKKTLSSPA